MNQAAVRARIAVARFAIQALGLYVKEMQRGEGPTMSLRQIAQAILDAVDQEDV